MGLKFSRLLSRSSQCMRCTRIPFYKLPGDSEIESASHYERIKPKDSIIDCEDEYDDDARVTDNDWLW